ncbi:MAG: protein BatD [Deltaproteobacteria bacterium]|nr:protein BatD [Deltaproteobacteria bacterium]
MMREGLSYRRVRFWAQTVLAVACLFAAPRPASAQVAKVRLEVDRQLLRVGEMLQITVSIEIDGRGGYDQYRPPKLGGLRGIGRETSSQSIQVINWKVRRQETHGSMALAEREGRFNIGPAEVLLKGRWVRSNRVTVTVRGRARAHAPPTATDVPGATRPPSGGDVPPNPADLLPPLFIAPTLTPQKVYVGQQVVAIWKLYTQSDVNGFRTLKQPTTDGFWSDELRSPRRLEWAQETLQGRTFYGAVLLRRALFPQRSGKIVVGSMKALVRAGSYFSRSQQVESKKVEIEVRALPEQGQPKDFPEQNVGRFELVASLTRDRLKAGEASTLKVVVRGHGNLRQLALPSFGPMEGLKIYQPKVTDRIRNERRIEGEKVFEYVILPTKGGRLQVPPIVLPFFDPLRGAYGEAKTRPLVLHVSGKVPSSGGGVDATKNVVGADDIRPPRAATSAIEDRPPASPLALHFFLLALLPMLGFTALVVVSRLRAQLSRQTERSLGRAAARRVKEHLSGARRCAQAGEFGRGYAELAAALREQVAHLLHERSEGLTHDELGVRMRDGGFDAALVHRLLEELEACDFARFAPASSGEAELKSALERVVDVIRALGRSLPSEPRGQVPS